ncbi:MAG: hypothetical protein IJK97_15980 [Thermoguttaceae bacterium]|nr:hypothetical protein [Thermoguttaceae bacterium]MBR0191574.1 hypothetical protein [Thermoguttaceae bacterium]
MIKEEAGTVDLKEFDEKCVRITDRWGDVFDGICTYNSDEYDEHEFGRAEESLQILSFLFYKSDINKIESLEEHSGPFGRFLDPFGKLEELTVEDGIDSINDVLFDEDEEHVLRLLRCLGEYLDPSRGHELPDREEVLRSLGKLAKEADDDGIRSEAQQLIGLWEKS